MHLNESYYQQVLSEDILYYEKCENCKVITFILLENDL